MATDEYMRDEIERSQDHQTRRRRKGRSRRKRVMLLVAVVIVALTILGAPSFLSHSPMGRSMVQRAAADYGFAAEIDSFSIGWITPLKVSGIQLKGAQAGSEISIQQVDTRLTVTDLWNGATDFGEIVVRGVDLRCSLREGRCSLEDDLSELLQPSDEPSPAPIGAIDVQDASILVTDEVTGASWRLTQSNAALDLTNAETRAKFAGVLSDPGGGGGAIQGSVQLPNAMTSELAWSLTLESESLPLSVATLVGRRFPQETAGLPSQLSGDATGAIQATGQNNGDIHASLHTLQVRNLSAREPGPAGRVWKNKLATFNGDVKLIGDRVIGRNLSARADFASATLDGAFSKSITLVGAKDNPLRWLEALDGTARADVDLALLDQALPGLLPIRSDAQLISGHAVAQINSLSSNQGRRSQLKIQSDSIRARTSGRAIVLDPITIDATVRDQNGQVHAEQFQLTSSFATAVGKGDKRNGHADFQVDFGRLSTMLRPLVDMSDTSLGGTANGKIQWNASEQNLWRLDGRANASNLLVTLPSGQSLKRNSLNATVNAVGRWGQQSLQELSRGNLTVNSSGLNMDVTLTQPVQQPGVSPLPIRLNATGRIETLTDILGPWLPAELHDAGGGFEVQSVAALSRKSSRIGDTRLALTNPKLAYGNRWFKQPSLKANFQGEFAWPSGDFNSRSLTVEGEAFTLAMEGQASANNVDVEVAWRAKLERVQGSVRKRVANWPANRRGTRAQTVSFPSSASIKTVQTDDWLVMGDCDGRFTIKSNGDELEIDSSSTGKNIAIVQPPDASAQSYTVGPMPQRPRTNGQFAPIGSTTSRVVWSEPNLRVNGLTRYNRTTGQVNAEGMQIAGDWFATTLTGHAIWNEATGDIVMKGPAKLKMDEISKRLTTLTGTAIQVEGIQQTPLEIHVARDTASNVAFTIQGNVGWDLGEIGGVRFGAATVPVRLTETTIEISPSVVPVGPGQVNLAGEVFYRPGPIWMRARPGVVARNLHLTPGMTNRWLKYLAPLAANTTNIDGTMSVELDEAIVVIDTPEQSRVRGRINVDRAQMTAGPVADQIIRGVDNLKAFVRNAPAEVRTQTKLVTMPPQTVEFALQNGIVRHERLFLEADRAQLMTSGDVSLNSQVNLTAQIPLHESWLGRDLASLEGQSVTLPITGSLSQPRLDSRGIRDVVTQLGTQAVTDVIEETADNYLKKELNKGIKSIEESWDKIFKR